MNKQYNLRPTYIGNEYYKHVIEETTSHEGQKRLTLITKDENSEEIGRQSIKNINELQKFVIEIEKDELENGQRFVTLHIKDEANKIVAKQKLQTFVPGKIKEQNFTDFYDVYDHQGKKINTVSIKKENDCVMRSHALFPLLVGSNYYQ